MALSAISLFSGMDGSGHARALWQAHSIGRQLSSKIMAAWSPQTPVDKEMPLKDSGVNAILMKHGEAKKNPKLFVDVSDEKADKLLLHFAGNVMVTACASEGNGLYKMGTVELDKREFGMFLVPDASFNDLRKVVTVPAWKVKAVKKKEASGLDSKKVNNPTMDMKEQTYDLRVTVAGL